MDLTWTVLTVVGSAAVTGAGIAWWFSKTLSGLRSEVLEAVAGMTKGIDEDVRKVTDRLAAISDRQHAHELHVEQKFISKETANLVFGRLELAIADLGRGIEAKLVRIEERLDRQRVDASRESRP